MTGKKKKYTLSETLDSFDDLEVDNKKLKSLQIAIHLPVKSNDMNSDIDSGDENVADGDASFLSGNQLLGCAAFIILTSQVVRGKDDEKNRTNDNQDLLTEPKKKKKKKIKDQAYQ